MTQVDPVIEAFLNEDNASTREEVTYDDMVNGPDEFNHPVIGNNVVELPGGLLTEIGIVRTVTVKELTGYDEEKLTRSDIKKPIDVLSKILMLGARVNDKPLTEHLMRSLLVGDRNAIILGIRRATFGNDLRMEGVTCPECQEKFDLTIELDEFECKTLDNPIEDRVFEVQLLRSKAKLRLETHGDIIDMLGASTKTVDQNTALLANCLIAIDDKPMELMPQNDPKDVVRALNMRDRQVLLEELSKRQPGPDLTGVKISCPSCDYEDQIGLDLIGLFRI